MKKTITITSRGEAQRLLVTGEVKSMAGILGPVVFDAEKGAVFRDGGHHAMMDGPWTYSIDVPPEAPKWRVTCVTEKNMSSPPAYDYSLARGEHERQWHFGNFDTAAKAAEAAQTECDARNAPKPVDLIVRRSITGKGLDLNAAYPGGGLTCDLHDALAAAGYKLGDAVQIVPKGVK